MKNYLHHFLAELRSVVRDRWLILSVALLGPAALGFAYLGRVAAWEDLIRSDTRPNVYDGRAEVLLVLFPLFALFAANRIFADINVASAGGLWRTWPVPVAVWAGARAFVTGVFLVLWPAFVVVVTGAMTKAPDIGGQLFITGAACWLAVVFGVYAAVRSPIGKVGITGLFIAIQIVILVAIITGSRLFFGEWPELSARGLEGVAWFYAIMLPIAAVFVIRRPVGRMLTMPEVVVITMTPMTVTMHWPVSTRGSADVTPLPEVSVERCTGDLVRGTNTQDGVEFRPIQITVPGWPDLNTFSTQTLSAEFRISDANGAGKWYSADAFVRGSSKGAFFLEQHPASRSVFEIATGTAGEARPVIGSGGDATFSLMIPTDKAKGVDVPAWKDVAGRRVEVRATVALTASRPTVAFRSSVPGKYDLKDDGDWRRSLKLGRKNRETRKGDTVDDWSLTILGDRKPQLIRTEANGLPKSYAVFLVRKSGGQTKVTAFGGRSWQGMPTHSVRTFEETTVDPKSAPETVLVESVPGTTYVVPMHIFCDVSAPKNPK